MRRVALAVIALALLATGCGKDRYEPRFGTPQKLADSDFAIAVAVDGNAVYFGDRSSGDVYHVNARNPSVPVRVGHVDVLAKGELGLMSLAAFRGRVYVSFVRADRHVVVHRLGDPSPLWIGPLTSSLRRDGHIAVDRDGKLHVSVGRRIIQDSTIVSKGWVNPFAFSIDTRDRLFVADQASKSGKERVARGREKDIAKRNRFSAVLPHDSKPTGLAILKDELLVCRSTYRDVFRIHVGIDNTPRRRSVLKGLSCAGAIATMTDGSVITATAHEIRRYPPR